LSAQELSALDVLGAARWEHAAFTTYALSLSFFEAVALDALVRAGSAPPLILADVMGVRGALSEYGARVVGKDYDIEPVSVKHGVFHAKVAALVSADDTHLVVGSGNLTFGGWGGNLEVAEHLHPSFAADAFDDAAAFFRALATTERATHDAGDRLERLAADLEARAASGVRKGDVRLLHNLTDDLTRQLMAQANDLGGATRLVVASPFWDDGAALAALCARLGLSEAFAHAHPQSAVEGRGADNWPRGCALPVHPVAIEWLAADERLLHAKVFEIQCRQGRLLFSGSANGTAAALGAGRNIEAGVLRISRDFQVGWALSAASKPIVPSSAEEADAEEQQATGVLRARLSAGRVDGRVLTSFPAGPAQLQMLAGGVVHELGFADIDAQGRFAWQADGMEGQGWAVGRVVLRLIRDSKVAEGFVAFADLAEIRRRTGSAAARLLAVLAHTDTPEDAAALMAWVWDNPQALSRGPGNGGDWGESELRARPLANVHELLSPPESPAAGRLPADGFSAHNAAWRRFLDNMFAALSAPREAFAARDDAGDDDDRDDVGDGPTPRELEAARKRAEDRRRRRAVFEKKAFANFERHFERVIGNPTAHGGLESLAAITQYICGALGAGEDRTRGYLQALVSAMVRHGDVDRDVAAAVVVVDAMSDVGRTWQIRARVARRRLLTLGWPPEGATPDLGRASGFQTLLCSGADANNFWGKVVSCSTAQEEVRTFKRAMEADQPTAEYPILSVRPEWAQLKSALEGSTRARREIYFVSADAQRCPCSSTALPSGVRIELRGAAIATASCGHVLLSEEF
jgi:hypothetical protein